MTVSTPAPLQVLLASLFICLFWACGGKDKSYDHQPQSLTNNMEYRHIAKHDEHISILCDFGISSAKPRFFVYDNRNKKLLSKSKCAHGCGGGSTSYKPVFSNKPGSECSSLGEYRLRCNDRMHNYGFDCIRIDGISRTNSNAAARGIVIHECPVIGEAYTTGIPIPMSKYISQGCFAISSETFKILQDEMKRGTKMYLYAICH